MELAGLGIESQIEDYRMALTTARFEKEFEKVFSRTSQLLDAEHSRMRCMEQLLLQIENDSLQLQLDQAKQELIRAVRAESDARLQLHDTSKEIDRLQNVVHVSSREMENLRHELASLGDVATESKKLLAEKIRVSKEISSIHSELERLRSQKDSSHALLAEKQALGRQVNTLEVQLEHEKRGHERILAKSSQHAEEMADLKAKLEATRRELEQTRVQKHDPIPSNSRERKSQNSKADNINSKLSPTKEPSQGTPTELQEPHEDSSRISAFTEKSNATAVQRVPTKLDPELTIATPGAVKLPGHPRRAFAMPGDKSSFSITPFLNRTTGLQDSTMSSDDELDELQTVGESSRLHEISSLREDSGSRAIGSQKRMVLAAGQAHKAGNQDSRKYAMKGNSGNRSIMRLSNDSDSGDEIGESGLLKSRLPVQTLAQSRKRKLGAQRDRSLFDDEEDDGGFRDTKKPGRRLVGTGHIQNLKSQLPNTRALAFSPLKRDKKRL